MSVGLSDRRVVVDLLIVMIQGGWVEEEDKWDQQEMHTNIRWYGTGDDPGQQQM